jgi:hypothetical protein
MAEARLKYPVGDDDRIGNSLIKFQFYETAGVGGGGDGRGAPAGVVDLYIPNGYQITDQIIYANTELGIGGEAFLRGDTSGFYEDVAAGVRGTQIESELGERERGITGIVDDVLSGLTRVGSLVARVGVAGVAPDAITGGIGLRTGRIVNPNVKATFRGINIRNFSFTFNMIPSSPEEASTIAGIVQKFRSAAYPATTSAGSTEYSLFLKYPQKCDITIFPSPVDEGGDPQYQVKFKPCYIDSVSVTRNAEGNSYFADGSPIQTSMTVGFVEQEVLTQEDILDGF